MNLEELYNVIKDRKEKMPENSYVASLFKEGRDRIIQKVGEESVEVVIAAKNETKNRLISEVADLIFHILILLSEYKITLKDIWGELARRRLSSLKHKE